MANFKTDVHRNKTKKWTTAQSYSYDGDDWGGYDGDDAYLEEPPPPAAPKTTGLRQRGQASTRSSNASSLSAPPLPASPPASSPVPAAVSAFPVPAQQLAPPSAPVHPPQPKPAEQPQLRNRASFEYGDEGAFSTGKGTEQQPPGSQRRPARVDSFPAQPPAPVSSQPTASQDMTALPVPPPRSADRPSNTSVGQTQQAPVNAQRTGPSEAVAPSGAQGKHFPPRKSSLSQGPRPNVENILASASAPAQQRQSVEAPREATSSPPFVRPADIYRRMEEEKQRASMDSGPGADTGRGRASIQGPAELDGGGHIHSQLDAVPERHSAYGMDGFPIHEEPSARPPPAQYQLGGDFLPKLDRFSGFGADLWGGSSFGDDLAKKDTLGSSSNTPTTFGQSGLSMSANENSGVQTGQQEGRGDLKPQPSLGFRSSVEHAFDNATGKSTLSPTTTASQFGSQRSTNESEFARTDSTAGISPIISRGPSDAMAANRAEERGSHTHKVSTIPEESSSGATSGSSRQQQALVEERKPSSPPASIPQGFRRSLTPPRGDNSPAHLPALNTGVQSHPSAADVSVTSPVARNTGHRASLDADHATDYSVRESDLAAVTKSPESPEHREAGEVSRDARASFLASHTGDREMMSPGVIPAPAEGEGSRPGSPSKGRVRDLAGKYNDLHDSRRNSGDSISSWASSKRSASPVKSPVVGSTEHASATKPHDSLRPQLPGSWVSYATTAASTDTAAPTPAPTSDDTNRQLSVTNPSETPDFSPNAPSGVAHSYAFQKAAEEQKSGLSAAGAAIAASLESSLGSGIASNDYAHSRGAGASSNLTTQSHLMSAMPAPLRGTGPHSSSRASDVGSGPYSPTSDGEYDPERLHDDIVRSLTPRNPPSEQTASSPQGLTPHSPPGSESMRESAVFPHEYDSYWGGQRASTSSVGTTQRGLGQPGGGNASDKLGKPLASKPKPLKHRFSWEDDEDDEDEDNDEELRVPHPTQSEVSELSAADADKGVKVHENREPSGISTELPKPEVMPAAPERAAELGVSELSPLRVSTTSTSSEATPSAKGPTELKSSLNTHPITPQSPPTTTFTEASRLPAAPIDPKARNIPLKEILAVKGFEPRMERYEQSQRQVATADTGLDKWLSHMIASHPEHATAASTIPLNTSGTRKITPGLSKLKSAGTPYYQQYLDSGPSVNASAGQAPSGTSGPIQDPNFKGRTLSQSRKDFFSTAGMIGGKATHSAKGLFAKGRSKFRQASTEKAE